MTPEQLDKLAYEYSLTCDETHDDPYQSRTLEIIKHFKAGFVMACKEQHTIDISEPILTSEPAELRMQNAISKMKTNVSNQWFKHDIKE